MRHIMLFLVMAMTLDCCVPRFPSSGAVGEYTCNKRFDSLYLYSDSTFKIVIRSRSFFGEWEKDNAKLILRTNMRDPEHKYFYEALEFDPLSQVICPEQFSLRSIGDKLIYDRNIMFTKSGPSPRIPYIDVNNDRGIYFNKVIPLGDDMYLLFYPEYETIYNKDMSDKCAIVGGDDVYIKNKRLYNGRVFSSGHYSYKIDSVNMDSIPYVDLYKTDKWIIQITKYGSGDIFLFLGTGVSLLTHETGVTSEEIWTNEIRTNHGIITEAHFYNKESFDKFCNDNNISLENIIRYYGDPDSVP